MVQLITEFQLWIYSQISDPGKHIGFVRGLHPETDESFIYFYPDKSKPTLSAIRKESISGFSVVGVVKDK